VHVAPVPQLKPHVPQLEASFARSLQELAPQGLKPPLHVNEHDPDAQAGLAFATVVVQGVHDVPHDCAEVSSAHWPAQSWYPVLHA
jgi:hypothetical protein